MTRPQLLSAIASTTAPALDKAAAIQLVMECWVHPKPSEYKYYRVYYKLKIGETTAMDNVWVGFFLNSPSELAKEDTRIILRVHEIDKRSFFDKNEYSIPINQYEFSDDTFLLQNVMKKLSALETSLSIIRSESNLEKATFLLSDLKSGRR